MSHDLPQRLFDPFEQPVSEGQAESEKHGEIDEHFPDMVEYEMPHFVAHHGQNFIRVGIFDERVG